MLRKPPRSGLRPALACSACPRLLFVGRHCQAATRHRSAPRSKLLPRSCVGASISFVASLLISIPAPTAAWRHPFRRRLLLAVARRGAVKGACFAPRLRCASPAKQAASWRLHKPSAFLRLFPEKPPYSSGAAGGFSGKRLRKPKAWQSPMPCFPLL